MINFGSNQELNTALENKRIDIALDMLGSWVGMITEGVPLTIIGETDWFNGGDKIIAKNAIDRVHHVNEEINVAVASVSSAVHEQTSATDEINKNIAESNDKVTGVNTYLSETVSSIQSIAEDIEEMGGSIMKIVHGSSVVKELADSFKNLAHRLENTVSHFKVS